MDQPSLSCKMRLTVALASRQPPDAYADLLRALSAIGNNINQLAHQANARGAATGDEITEALHLVRQATRLVRERL